MFKYVRLAHATADSRRKASRRQRNTPQPQPAQSMRVLVLGSGAREHALVMRLAAEAGAESVCCAPGNPGIARLVRTIAADLQDVASLAMLASRQKIDLTVVGPELLLSLGVADRFADAGLRLFGPTAAAARL